MFAFKSDLSSGPWNTRRVFVGGESDKFAALAKRVPNDDEGDGPAVGDSLATPGRCERDGVRDS